ncbi:MAG: hypothetical protein M1819_000997 [Sarea resinae]|nr:MAG: hypothetical protein M1819_000997 [Sarea resinae]
MLVGLCGGICAGKQSVANFLIDHCGFQVLHLAETASRAAPKQAASGAIERGQTSNPKSFGFSDTEALLDFVTRNWNKRWLTTEICVWDEELVEILLRRPFFLLVSVDAPLGIRWSRYKARCERQLQTPPTLEDFVIRNDAHLYDPLSGVVRLTDRAEVRLLNSTSSLESLHAAVSTLDLTNDERLRPSWDQYFMRLAALAAQRSNCMKRRVGCVLVRDRRVISTGYNGTPRNLRNCNEGGCPRCNDGNGAGVGLATCLCIHAEENALLEAGRERIREKTILYCDTCPCLTCSIKITQVGISEVVYSQAYSMDTETAAVFKEGGVHLRQFSPPRNGLIDLASLPI